MEIIYYGHSAFLIDGSKKVFIDPFLTGNPSATTTPDDIKECDMVTVTHDHPDHMGDGFAICKNTGATFVSQHELAVMAQEEGIKAEGMNIGGTISVDGVQFHMTLALHTTETGHPTGIIVSMDNHSIYHAGDTGLFSDMKLIGEMYKPEIALLPIGDRYTMGLKEAVKAVELIGSPYVIPMHYGTMPVLNDNPEEFKEEVGDMSKVIILKPGEKFEI
jgi:L-ascorbate metabolism protein UlaG (beta-lactamase superfamily)